MVETAKKIAVLREIAHRFNEAGIVWALGASMLLYYKGLVPEFHDIDLMIADGDADRVREVLCKMGTLQPPNPNPKYRTRTFLEFTVAGVDVDVMAGFSIVNGDEVVDCSLRPAQIVETIDLDGECIPLQSLALWGEYYRLMGRTAKAELIQSALAGRDGVRA